jgi:hypothetical protein
LYLWRIHTEEEETRESLDWVTRSARSTVDVHYGFAEPRGHVNERERVWKKKKEPGLLSLTGSRRQ